MYIYYLRPLYRMSQLNPVKNESSPDQVYFDITVSNFQSTTTTPPVFFFNEQRTMPFISNPEEYYLSILRFTMETGSLPVFIPSIEPNQGDRDKSIYSVTLEYDDPVLGTTYTSGQTFIDWQPQDRSALVPPPPNQCINNVQNNSTGYYNCYSYSYWIYLIDLALVDAFTTLSANVVAGGVAMPTIYAPFLNWDTTSNQAVLYGDAAGYSVDKGGINVDNIRIYFNAPLYGLFNSFPAEYLGYTGVADGKNFQLIIPNVGAVNLLTITPIQPTPVPPATFITYRAIALYQEISTIANWSPITALVFTSNTLPIQSNQVSTPIVYDDAETVVFSGNNSNIANIITDMVTYDGQYRPNVVYTPSAEYRLVTLYGNRPLSNVDLSIFWRTKTGQLIPYRINSGEAVTLKLAFLKKSAYRAKGELKGGI